MVLVLGAFDLLHWGHLRFLKAASRFGAVTVGLSTDDFLVETKRRPAVPYEDRKLMLEELGYTVHPRPSADVQALVKGLQPTMFVCGSDWLGTDHLDLSGLTVDFLNEHELTVAYVPRSHDMSTTRILGGISGH